jgi:hypothetical protein
VLAAENRPRNRKVTVKASYVQTFLIGGLVVVLISAASYVWDLGDRVIAMTGMILGAFLAIDALILHVVMRRQGERAVGARSAKVPFSRARSAAEFCVLVITASIGPFVTPSIVWYILIVSVVVVSITAIELRAGRTSLREARSEDHVTDA